jgi:hypothetical protein
MKIKSVLCCINKKNGEGVVVITLDGIDTHSMNNLKLNVFFSLWPTFTEYPPDNIHIRSKSELGKIESWLKEPVLNDLINRYEWVNP